MKLNGMGEGADAAIEEAEVVSLEKTYSTKFYSVDDCRHVIIS